MTCSSYVDYIAVLIVPINVQPVYDQKSGCGCDLKSQPSIKVALNNVVMQFSDKSCILGL